MKKHSSGNFVLAWRLSFVFATALLLLAGPPRGRRALIPIPEPANEILKLEYILNVWRCQNMVEMEDLDWFSNISDDERQALRQASGPAMRSQAKVASELLHQAYLLHQEPESQIVADKLFVLAARAHRDSGYDPDQIRRISTVGGPVLRNEARKILLLREAVGKPYSELAALGAPIPDLSRFHGSPVVLFFWSSWDAGFQAQWPALKQELIALSKNGIEIVSINFDADVNISSSFLAQEGVPWLGIFPRADEGIGPSDYNLQTFPALWLVDSHGRVVSTRFSPKAFLSDKAR